MGFFSHDSEQGQAYQQVYQNDPENKASFGHELLSGAAAFAAMHEYEKHEANEGRPTSHGKMKELAAAFAGAEADKLAESYGANFIDREKIKHSAKKQAEEAAGDYYQQNYQ